MKAFRRVFKYVWPQWPRIIVVVVSAIIVASLLSLSFLTVIPLLKVMMGEEGLGGWADRKISAHRYGLIFYVPEKTDFAESDIAHYLLVTDIKKDSLAQGAGLQKLDRIIGVNNLLVKKDEVKIPSTELLEALATADPNSTLAIQLLRLDEKAIGDIETLTLNTGPKPFYLHHLEKWTRFLPRQQSREDKARAVTFIVL
ncbi:MAG: hypothetical protein ACYTBX_08055, partial [Planctomycetota bacterium]